MMVRWAGLVVLAACATIVPAPTRVPALRAPGLRLPRAFVPTGYEARLAIDPDRRDFDGELVMEGDIAAPTGELWLHGEGLEVFEAELRRDGQTRRLAVRAVDTMLRLSAAAPIGPGHYRLRLRYRGWLHGGHDRTGRPDDLGAYRRELDGRRYVLTELESVYARRVFPCVDEPDLKVRWQLTLEVPRELVAVSNTSAISELSLDRRTKRVTFAPTRPLPSYLVAFAVGPFDVLPAGTTRAGKPIRVIVPHARAPDAAWPVETAAKLVGLLEGYFAMPYPYSKLDLVIDPGGDLHAMENPGLLVFSAHSALHGPDRRGPEQRRTWLEIAAHELAHQWFGDAVTAAWWNDLWLSEGVATWLQARTVAAFDPAYDRDTLALDDRWAALADDDRPDALAIRRPIATTYDILTAFDNIVYRKTARVLMMFERTLGPEVFRAGVRAYIAEHRDRSATAADFLAAISRAAGHDVAPAFHGFLDQPGVPVVRAELRCAAGQAPVVALAQHRDLSDAIWRIPVCVAYDAGGRRAEACTELTAATGELALPVQACPAWLFANAGHGYYRAVQPVADAVALRDRGWSQLTAAERAVAFDDLLAAALRGELDLAIPMALVPAMLAAHDLGSVDRAVAAARAVRAVAPAAQQPAIAAWIRATFGPDARRVGWLARPTDDLVDATVRGLLVDLVARAGDPELAASAVALAPTWRTLPPERRASVLQAAADADPAFATQLRTAALAERDPELRDAMLGALGDLRDPAALREVLPLVLDRRLSDLEAASLVEDAELPDQRRVVADYLRDHVAELLARFPDGTYRPAGFARPILRICDPATRDADLAFVRDAFGKLRDADDVIAKGLALRDRCDARSARVAAWAAALR
jgi:alanyl aminopeptidase